jgi:LysM repeat protein
LLGVLVVVGAAWGVYAWRFAGSPRRQPAEQIAQSEAAAPDETAQTGRMATLRATRSPGINGMASPDVDRFETDAIGDESTAASPMASITTNLPASISGRRAGASTPLPSKPMTETPPEMEAGRIALARGDLNTAQAALSEALQGNLSPADRAFACRELERISDALLFSRAMNTEGSLTRVHTVAGGENLHMIAQRYKITADLLASINGLADPNRLCVGAKLKVIQGPFNAVIYKSAHRMEIYLGDVFVRSFRVGLGTNGGTPLGTWTVMNKLKNPEWTDPTAGQRYLADDPDNPIGERWIGLHGIDGQCVGRVGFGIHGTIEPKSIGENMSMGCIRLVPKDIAAVYDLLVNEYSRVVIRP